MRYGITARVYGGLFLRMLRAYYKKHFPKADFSKIKRAVKTEYRAMVERTPGIGGSSLETELMEACFFFAMAKAIPGMTPERMDDIIAQSIQSAFMQKAHEGKRKKGTLFSDRVQDKKAREAEKSHRSPYEMDWEFTYQKGRNGFTCTYTQCGICKLAKRERTERFLPCMCRMDFATYKMVGAKLIRTKTLANGDECCNFHVIREVHL